MRLGSRSQALQKMDAVETVQADGTPRGTLTTAWVVEMNELDWVLGWSRQCPFVSLNGEFI